MTKQHVTVNVELAVTDAEKLRQHAINLAYATDHPHADRFVDRRQKDLGDCAALVLLQEHLFKDETWRRLKAAGLDLHLAWGVEGR